MFGQRFGRKKAEVGVIEAVAAQFANSLRKAI